MVYKDLYSEEIIKKLLRIKRKNGSFYISVRKKMDWIIENPLHKFKNLKHNLKGYKRIHLGHFVLIFIINHENQEIFFEDFDHHDKAYLS